MRHIFEATGQGFLFYEDLRLLGKIGDDARGYKENRQARLFTYVVIHARAISLSHISN